MITTNYNNKTSFQGKIVLKKSVMNNSIREHLMNLDSISLKNMLRGHDVIIRTKTKHAKYPDLTHYEGQELYKILFSRVKEGSKLGKFLDKLHLKPRKSITKYYHSENGILQRINEERMQHIWRKLG